MAGLMKMAKHGEMGGLGIADGRGAMDANGEIQIRFFSAYLFLLLFKASCCP